MDDGGFGARLRSGRRSAGLSQQELAERAGLSIRTISDLERGRTRWPYRDSVQRLADALGLRDTPRANFIAAAGRRLAPAAATASAGSPAGEDRRAPGGRGVPRHLPAAVPAFVGRRDQLAALSQVLDQPGGTAVITAIGGTAGVGKTALAVKWAHQVAGQFPDGQLFVNLRGFTPSGPPLQADEAVRMLLDALQIPADRLPQTAEGQLGLYRSLLAGKRMLVILDNARDASQVRPLLPGSPTCRVVVTSRNQLTSLAAIDAAHPLTLDVLTPAEARQLLQERLGAGRLDADQDAVTQIIRSCAHLPLALCIIAARAAMRPELTLAQVAADLVAHPNLDAFTDGGDPAADVRGAFSWSYRQLDSDAARAFRLAGLHPGPGLDRHAVAALAGTTTQQAERALDALARACMIQPTGPGRYSLHDLLRNYARELTDGERGEPGQRAALGGLLDYYLRTAAAAMDVAFPAERHRRPQIPAPAAAAPEFSGAAEALAWLDAERPNLVAMAGHAAEHGWPGHATRLAGTLFRYLDTGGHYPAAVIIHGHARRAARLAGDREAEADALIGLALIDGHQGSHQQASIRFEQALALAREIGYQDGQARALNYLGLVHAQQGRYQQAISHIQRAVVLFRGADERTGAAYALGNLGAVSMRQGRHREAGDYQQEALALFRELGDWHGEASILTRLGLIELRQDRYQQAAGHLRQALATYRDIGDQQGEASALRYLAVIDLQRGHYEHATDNLRQSLVICRDIGDQQGEAETLNSLGDVLLATGHPADARRQHAAALHVAAKAGVKYDLARAHDGLARACQASGGLARARRHWQEALAIFTGLGAPEAEEIRARLAQVTTITAGR